tara:strand:- start:437 stop:628 length:192 start_codon:yes stop_codon:yes gene_type:complete
MNNTLETILNKAEIKFESASLRGSRFGIRASSAAKIIDFLAQMGATEITKTESFGEFVICGNL